MSNKMLTQLFCELTFSLREERELERKFYFKLFSYCCRFFCCCCFFTQWVSLLCEIGTRAEGTLLKWLLRKCMCLNHLLLFPPSIFLFVVVEFFVLKRRMVDETGEWCQSRCWKKRKNKTGTNNSQDEVIAVCLWGSCLVCRWSSSSFCFFFFFWVARRIWST